MPKSALPTGTRKSAGTSATPKANTAKAKSNKEEKKNQQQPQQQQAKNTQQSQQTQQTQPVKKQNYPSKKAAWVADQIAQGKKPEQRNFLAETATQKQNIYSSDDDDDLDFERWAKKEESPKKEQTPKDKKLALKEKQADEQDRKQAKQEANKKYENYVFGKYGNGNDRVIALRRAGYPPEVVQTLVNHMLF